MEGGAPPLRPGKGVLPPNLARGTPPDLGRGSPHLDLRGRYLSIQTWEGATPTWTWEWGTPLPGLGKGVPLSGPGKDYSLLPGPGKGVTPPPPSQMGVASPTSVDGQTPVKALPSPFLWNAGGKKLTTKRAILEYGIYCYLLANRVFSLFLFKC